MNIKKLLSLKPIAPLWKRVFAYVIDALIIAVIIGWPMKKSLSDKTSITFSILKENPALLQQILIISLLIALLTVLYFSILEFKLKQTVGKIIVGIRVESTSKTLTYPQCFLRNLTKSSFIILLLDCIPILFRKHQRYFERLSNTEVLENG